MNKPSIADYLDNLAMRLAAQELCFAHGTETAFDEACYLVLASLGIPFADATEQRLSAPLSKSQQELLDQRAELRISQQVPTAYLVGKAWFAGHQFICDNRALVPRSPIAELINNGFEAVIDAKPTRILDLCTGGGCIGLSAALQFPEAEVVLADLSAEALSLAEENLQALDSDGSLKRRVRLVQSDLFDKVPGQFDLIISNPPYVSEAEWSSLPAEFHHEPSMGLVSEQQGLAIPLKILRQSYDKLLPEGMLVLEVGYSADALQARCEQFPFLWLEFEHGGDGVLAVARGHLEHFGAELD